MLKEEIRSLEGGENDVGSNQKEEESPRGFEFGKRRCLVLANKGGQ